MTSMPAPTWFWWCHMPLMSSPWHSIIINTKNVQSLTLHHHQRQPFKHTLVVIHDIWMIYDDALCHSCPLLDLTLFHHHTPQSSSSHQQCLPPPTPTTRTPTPMHYLCYCQQQQRLFPLFAITAPPPTNHHSNNSCKEGTPTLPLHHLPSATNQWLLHYLHQHQYQIYYLLSCHCYKLQTAAPSHLSQHYPHHIPLKFQRSPAHQLPCHSHKMSHKSSCSSFSSIFSMHSIMLCIMDQF